ncbi:DNA (cytosine-5-)-methyltransferase [Synechococcus elongatus]|uniref:DNA (cytosine-5-)-methyltransferase n=1 Tax=Synechococcus elongatus TaxID=32046 RepID=UPI0023514B9A|nr:DNA (cytosine-5-)-methyltransferase [Synechococcus elongatus]WKW05437.1 DNA (cytosine-5-)-methyltransferase [Synechococcus elongatus PCC 7942 = FACHB-805]
MAEALKRFSKRELAKHLGKDPRIITAFQRDGVDETYKMALLYLLQSNTPRPNQGKKHDFTFIDLFAGIGGTRMGFERAGGKCVFTSEWDTSAQKTYRANFSVDEHPIIGDIHEITVEGKWDLLPEHDVLVAGFPCQPFSIAGVSKKNSLGRAHGFACDAQGTLFFDIATIIERRRPKAFLLENVKNLMSHDKGNTFRVIKNVLEDELGYKIYPKIIDAKGFVPQHRERIYIVGFREEVGFNWDSFSQPPTDTKCMADILHPNDGSEEVEEPYTVGIEAKVNDKYTLSDKLWNYLQNYANKHRAAGNGFGFGLVNKDSIARTLSARYYKDGSEILVDQGKDKNPRRLTPRECARLMGFDSSEHKFNIVVADTPAYKQFGNSVVVPVITEIAHTMKPSIIQLKERYIRQISLAI